MDRTPSENFTAFLTVLDCSQNNGIGVREGENILEVQAVFLVCVKESHWTDEVVRIHKQDFSYS